MNTTQSIQIYTASGPFRNEDEFQTATAKFLDGLMEKGLIGYFFTGNNIYRRFLGKSKSICAGAKAKRMGSKPGIPDILIWSHRIAIELKMPKGHLTPEQRKFFNLGKKWGWECYCCRTPEQVVGALKEQKVL